MKIIIHSVIFQFRQNIPKDAEHHILIAPDTTTGQFFKDIGPNSYFENKEGISKTYRLSCTDGSKAAATVKNFPHPLDMTVSYTYQGTNGYSCALAVRKRWYGRSKVLSQSITDVLL